MPTPQGIVGTPLGFIITHSLPWITLGVYNRLCFSFSLAVSQGGRGYRKPLFKNSIKMTVTAKSEVFRDYLGRFIRPNEVVVRLVQS